MLAVDDILGWNLDDQIRGAADAQAEDEGTIELLRDALVSFYQNRAKSDSEDLEASLVEALQSVNLKLKESGAATLSDRAFARGRREFGFQDRVNVLKRRRDRGRRVLVFDAKVRAALGIGPEPISLEAPASEAKVSFDDWGDIEQR